VLPGVAGQQVCWCSYRPLTRVLGQGPIEHLAARAWREYRRTKCEVALFSGWPAIEIDAEAEKSGDGESGGKGGGEMDW